MKFAAPEERQFIITGDEAEAAGQHEPHRTIRGSGERQTRTARCTAVNLYSVLNSRRKTCMTSARVARLSKAQADYQTALVNAEKVFAAGMAKINAPGVFPGSRDAKGMASKVSLADYEKEKAALLDNLVKAKNAAHEASQAAQVENDPEHFQARPGYGSDAMPLPVQPDQEPTGKAIRQWVPGSTVSQQATPNNAADILSTVSVRLE